MNLVILLMFVYDIHQIKVNILIILKDFSISINNKMSIKIYYSVAEISSRQIAIEFLNSIKTINKRIKTPSMLVIDCTIDRTTIVYSIIFLLLLLLSKSFRTISSN